jgi:hypothetical protein
MCNVSLIDELNRAWELKENYKEAKNEARKSFQTYGDLEYNQDDVTFYSGRYQYYRGQFIAYRNVLEGLGLQLKLDRSAGIYGKWVAHN